MRIPSFKEIEKITDSRYELVMLVAKRARKIVQGEEPLVKTTDANPVSIAIDEVLDEKIIFNEPMSDKKYKEKIDKEREELIARIVDEIEREELEETEEEE